MKTLFSGCSTVQEVKARYKELAKKFHPDCGGTKESFQALQEAFLWACQHCGETNENETPESLREYMDRVNGIINLEGINIDLVGSWIWITGNTYPHREAIKRAGFKFAGKKRAWYWHAGEYKKRGSKKSLEEIKRLYGSTSLNENRRPALVAG